MFSKFLDDKRVEFYSHIDNDIIKRIERAIEISELVSLSEYQAMRLNSYEQKVLEPYLSDEAFIWKITGAISNSFKEMSTYDFPTTYNEYILTDGIHELLIRFKRNLNENKNMVRA